MRQFLIYLSITLMSVMILRLIKSYYHDLALVSSLLTVVFISGVSLSILIPIVEYINYLATQYSIGYLSLLWKALAISILTATSADLCRSAEEEAIAAKVELLGKCELLVIALPLFRDLADLVMRIAEGMA